MPYKKKKDYTNYMAEYMRQYRKAERKLIQQARKQLGMSTKIKRKKRSTK